MAVIYENRMIAPDIGVMVVEAAKESRIVTVLLREGGCTTEKEEESTLERAIPTPFGMIKNSAAPKNSSHTATRLFSFIPRLKNKALSVKTKLIS